MHVKLNGSEYLITPNTPDTILSNLRKNHLGFVFQSFNLMSTLNALENVELPMILRGIPNTWKERRERAVQGLRTVGMGHRLFHYPNKLSGGEQQRVTIARAIVCKDTLVQFYNYFIGK